MMQAFLKNTGFHGGVVSTAVAIAADALIERQPEQEFNHARFWTCTWARSLFLE